jgi:hypothetical protein
VPEGKTLCLLLFISGHTLAYAEEQDLIIDDTELQQGKGVIIELEDNTDLRDELGDKTASDRAAKSKKKSGRKQIELIVGGQGEDGVAKRGSLIIDD